jgi:putative transposase
LKFALAHDKDQSLKPGFQEQQIIGILKVHEAGVFVTGLCRKHGVSDAGIYNGKPSLEGWRSLCPSSTAFTMVKSAR